MRRRTSRPEVLEQVRLLTNLETNTQKLLQIILIGQPELRELLDRNELRQLAQRITGRYHLCPLTIEETTAYVRHRLRVAGATADIFTPSALREVHRLSRGVPRLINVLCDRALLGAYTQDRHQVGASLVRRGAMEVFGRHLAPWWLPWTGVAAALVACCSGCAVWRCALEPRGESAASLPVHSKAPPQPPAPWRPQRRRLRPRLRPPRMAARSGCVEPHRRCPAHIVARALLPRDAAETRPTALRQAVQLWGVHYLAGSADPCTQAAQQGLECFVQNGSLAQLRLYNRPAILMLTDEREAASGGLAGLDDDHAHIDIGSATQRSASETCRAIGSGTSSCCGARAPTMKPLSPGMHGEDEALASELRRLRATRQRARQRCLRWRAGATVRDFQRAHRLTRRWRRRSADPGGAEQRDSDSGLAAVTRGLTARHLTCPSFWTH